MGRVLVWTLMAITVLAGVGAAGLMMGTVERYVAFGRGLCPVSIIAGLLFLVLAARQSRLDKQQ